MKKRKFLPVAIALMAVIAISGVAYAYWSSSGSGNGSAGVGTSTALTVSSDDVTNLVPDAVDHDVTVHVVNPAAFSQSLSAVAITVVVNGLDVEGAPGCLAAWFTVTNPTILAPIVLTKTGTSGASTDVVGKIRMTDSSSNQDDCKNAKLTLHFAVS